MKQVEFNEQKSIFDGRRHKARRPVLVRWMMKLSFIKTQRQANIALIVITIAALVASYLILNNTFNLTGSDDQTYIEDLTPEEREELPPEFLEALPSRQD
ncbi:MAG: hypothetical protein WD175_02375 [Candidatus Paceibacterota bacterium]